MPGGNDADKAARSKAGSGDGGTAPRRRDDKASTAIPAAEAQRGGKRDGRPEPHRRSIRLSLTMVEWDALDCGLIAIQNRMPQPSHFDAVQWQEYKRMIRELHDEMKRQFSLSVQSLKQEKQP